MISVCWQLWLDALGFDPALGMVLKYPSGAACEKSYDDNRDECSGGRMRDKPCVKLEQNHESQHSDDCEPAAAEDTERKSA